MKGREMKYGQKTRFLGGVRADFINCEKLLNWVNSHVRASPQWNRVKFP